MFALEGFSAQHGFELIGQQLDELSRCLEQMNSLMEHQETSSYGLWNGGWNERAFEAVAGMRSSLEAFESLVMDNDDVNEID